MRRWIVLETTAGMASNLRQDAVWRGNTRKIGQDAADVAERGVKRHVLKGDAGRLLEQVFFKV